jgi:hypothetical protein
MVDDAGVHLLRWYGNEGLSEKPNGLCGGMNSGYQAVGLAIAAGATHIILLGYDMVFPGGRSHWHNGHGVQVAEMTYRAIYRKYMDEMPVPPGVDIVNCSPISALKAFRKEALESVLPD